MAAVVFSALIAATVHADGTDIRFSEKSIPKMFGGSQIELMERIEAGNLPDSVSISDFIGDGEEVSFADAEDVRKICEAFARVEVVGDDPETGAFESDVLKRVLFRYDDFETDLLMTEEAVYVFGDDPNDDAEYAVKGADEILKSAETRKKENEDAEKDFEEKTEGAFFTAERTNLDLVDSASDYVAQTKYAVMDDGTVLIMRVMNLSGPRTTEADLSSDEFRKFRKKVEKEIVGTKKDSDGVDGFTWRMSAFSKDGKETGTFSGYVYGNGKIEELADELRIIEEKSFPDEG